MKKIVEKNIESQLRLLEEIVSIDSGSKNLEGIKAVSEVIKRELVELGFNVQLFSYEKAGNCLFADFSENSEKKILLLGHMDTVFPDGTSKKRPFKQIDGKAYGPGVLDMKGGISQMIYALKVLKEQGIPLNRIVVLLVGDEEVGHLNSDVVSIMEKLAKTTEYVFCCESGRMDGKFVTGRKGTAGITLKAHGKASHAGSAYAKGINAILELSHKIIRLQSFTSPDLSLTVSVGNVTGGGPINVVPDYAEANFDVRISDFNKYKELEEKIKKLCEVPDIPGARCEYDTWLEYPPMHENEQTQKMIDLLDIIRKEKGYPPIETCAVGGGADSSYFALYGVPVICAFGPTGEHNHTQDEYITIDGLKERTLFLTQCLEYFLLK